MTIDSRIAAGVTGPGGTAEQTDGTPCLMTRRSFLLLGGMTTAVVMVGVPGLAQAETPAVVATYPKKFIASFSSLIVDEPVDFTYPDEGEYSESMLVKLPLPCGRRSSPRPNRPQAGRLRRASGILLHPYRSA